MYKCISAELYFIFRNYNIIKILSITHSIGEIKMKISLDLILISAFSYFEITQWSVKIATDGTT